MDVTDDPESPDAAPLHTGDASGRVADGGFDLSPRTRPARDPRTGAGSTRRYVAIGALVAVLVALGAVLFIGLNDAATFFYNVDEALDQRADLGADRFRMQGNVVEGSVTDTADGVDFVITFNGAEVPVHHTGTPPELFGSDIPVVLGGTFAGDTFNSDEILVRHDNEYDEDHPERVDEAERDAQATGGAGGGPTAGTEVRGAAG